MKEKIKTAAIAGLLLLSLGLGLKQPEPGPDYLGLSEAFNEVVQENIKLEQEIVELKKSLEVYKSVCINTNK